MSHPDRSHWAGSAVLVIALAILSVVGPAAPSANAHDQILSTTPGDAEHLETAPTKVTMRFSEDVLDIGAIVLIVDGVGKNWAAGAVHLDRAQATQALQPGLADGAYQVRWRVVSADGHPVAGTFTFSVGNVAPTGSTAPSTNATATTKAPLDDAAAESTGGATRNDGFPTVVVGLIGAGIGIAIFVIFVLIARRRTSRRRP
jgi:methionine-rich copper-binding protein CopC